MLKRFFLIFLTTLTILQAVETKNVDQKAFNMLFNSFVEKSDNPVAEKLRKHPELVKQIDLDKMYQNFNKYKDKNVTNESVKKEIKKDVKKNKNDVKLTPFDYISLFVLIGILNLFIDAK